MTAVLAATVHRKVLKQIFVGELRPDDTVDAVREARLLAKVTLGEAGTASYMGPMLRMSLAYSITYIIVHACIDLLVALACPAVACISVVLACVFVY